MEFSARKGTRHNSVTATQIDKPTEQLESVAIRFAGDSGDGMQLTGTKFTDETALAGNDLSTFPDFPAEIRAPAGTMAGVSGFQIHFSSEDIHTPADRPDVLIAFNPAALRANVDDVRPGGMVIINIDSFNEKAQKRAGYEGDPLPELRDRYNLVEIPFTTLNRQALVGLDLSSRDIDRCKNFFALGVLCWLYGRPMNATERWLGGKFKGEVLEGNVRTLKAGHAFGETTELPLVAINVQRAGPSTGSPTKTEQGDLLAVLHGRHSQSPIPVIAASTPGDCFHTALEAFRMAVKYMTPVIVLSDGYIANSSEPWQIPDVDGLEQSTIEFAKPIDVGEFQPYSRDPETLARPWAIPGTPGLEHRIGGLTKQDGSGNVSYEADNHAKMIELRKQKVEGIANSLPPLEINGPDSGELLVLGWGGTKGSITAAVEQVRKDGLDVSQVHLRHLNPFPNDLGDVLKSFKKVLLPELSDGHLALLLRAKYLVDIQMLNKIEGQPFKIVELTDAITKLYKA